MFLTRQTSRLLLLASFALAIPLCLSTPALADARQVRAGLEQNPPLSFINEQGQASGLLVDLLNHVAAAEGWQVTYVPDTFDRCLEKLRAGELDLMVTIAYSAERAELFDFNRLDVVANWGVLYAAQGHTYDSYFALSGKKIAVMRRDIHYRALRRMLEAFGIGVSYLELDNFDQVFTAVQDGSADTGVVGRFYALRREDAYRVQPTPIIFNPIEVHYAVRKGGNTELLATLDRHLESLKAQQGSYYYDCLERWLGVLHKDALPSWLRPALFGGGALVALLLLFVVLLRQQVKSRTRHLEHEISERQRAQRALQESARNYRDLVESARAIILRWTVDGRVTFINDYAEELFGYAREELVGQHVVGTIVPEFALDGTELSAMIRAIGEHPEQFSVNENENLRKDGGRVWIAWRNRTVHDERGEVVGLLSVGIDVTAKHVAEETQRQLDRAKDHFIATAAHELRTPLTTIIGYAELLRNDLATDAFNAAEKTEYLDYIYDRGLVLARIVNDLLDITLIQRGESLPLRREPASLLALAQRIVEQYRTLHTTYQVRLDAPEVLTEFDFDPERIAQVLENLLNNAIKYSPHPGEIVLSLANDPDLVRIAVTDQGIGMTPEQVARIFDKFYRADTSNTAVGGLGLGMHITRQIVESHGGRIWVESTPGSGTTITFTLPKG